MFRVGIDEDMSLWQYIVYGAQHMLIVVMTPFVVPMMFLGIFGPAFGVDFETASILVSTMLIFAGISTLTRPFFRLPIMEAQSILYIIVMIPLVYAYGFSVAYFAMLIGGVIACLLTLPFRSLGLVGRITPYLSRPIVIGTLFTVMGISLIPDVCINFIFPPDASMDVWNTNVILGTVSFTVPLLLTLTFRKGILRYASILIGIVVGACVAWPLGVLDLSRVFSTPLFMSPQLFPLGFTIPSSLDVMLVTVGLMLIANLVDFVDSLGCFAGVSRMSKEKMSEDQVNKALFTETALSTFSVIFGNVPTTSYAQNVAVLSQTRIASKKMIATGGIMLIVLGLIYPLGVLVISIPQAVYGGALLMTFGMLTLIGVEILRDIEWTEENRVIASFALGSGLICIFLPDKWLNSITPALGLLLSSPPILSVLVTIIISVVYRALER